MLAPFSSGVLNDYIPTIQIDKNKLVILATDKLSLFKEIYELEYSVICLCFFMDTTCCYVHV